jgi:hypothetical protein
MSSTLAGPPTIDFAKTSRFVRAGEGVAVFEHDPNDILYQYKENRCLQFGCHVVVVSIIIIGD